jgi:two-component system chemotaxis response regulator CheY
MIKSCITKDKAYEIYEAADGRDGIKKYQEVQPDVTFMDLTMPELDGYHAIAEIRKISDNAIIVVTTADIQRRSVSRVIELGAFLVLKKPPKAKIVQDVLVKVEEALQNTPRRKQ